MSRWLIMDQEQLPFPIFVIIWIVWSLHFLIFLVEVYWYVGWQTLSRIWSQRLFNSRTLHLLRWKTSNRRMLLDLMMRQLSIFSNLWIVPHVKSSSRHIPWELGRDHTSLSAKSLLCTASVFLIRPSWVVVRVVAAIVVSKCDDYKVVGSLLLVETPHMFDNLAVLFQPTWFSSRVLE